MVNLFSILWTRQMLVRQLSLVCPFPNYGLTASEKLRITTWLMTLPVTITVIQMLLWLRWCAACPWRSKNAVYRATTTDAIHGSKRWPTAIVASTDVLAIGVLRGALATGIRVPEEVAVLAIGNDHMLCDYAATPLSSIDMNLEQVGWEAARLLHGLTLRFTWPPLTERLPHVPAASPAPVMTGVGLGVPVVLVDATWIRR